MNDEAQLALTAEAGQQGIESAALAPEQDGAAHEVAQHLVFRLGDSLYAVDALAVRESHWLPALTLLDQTPPHIIGIANVRGVLIPVMDLAQRLGRAPGIYGAADQMVVLEHDGARIALAVNEVRDVRVIHRHQIESHPAPGHGVSSIIAGVAQSGGELVMLLHLPNLLQSVGEFEYSNGAINLHSSDGTGVAGAPQHRFDAAEDAILRDRAQRLMQRDAERDFSGLVPLALVALGGEHFGIALGAVREFCQRRHITPVPCCPPHIAGQMNLRGDILTLIDIRSLLQLPPRSDDSGKVVVVEHEEMHVGLLIDDVLDVLYLRAAQLADVSSATGVSGGKYFSGGVLLDNRVVCLLDLAKILDEGNLVVDEAV
jgi:purine-binding chemotaxis protein CheW